MDTLDLAKRLISYDTTSPVKDIDVFQFLQGYLQGEGVTVSIHDFNGVKNLVAQTGDGDTSICLNGHIDVVGAENGWTVTDPFEPVVKDGKLYGRGAADMKSGLAAQINAFLDLHRDAAFEGSATLMVVGDEEVGGFDGTQALLEQYDGFDYAIVGEPTDGNIQVGVRGLYWVHIYLQGTSAHASRPQTTDNVVEDLPAVLKALSNLELTYDEPDELPAPTAPITVVETSGPHNSIPGQVRVGLDIRHVPGQTEEQIRTDIARGLDPLDVDYDIRIENHGAAFILEDDKFRDIVTETVADVTGERPDHITDGGSSDGRFFAEQDTPFIELGPNQEPAHQGDEHCHVDSLEQLRKSYYRIAQRLAAEQ